MPAASTSVLPRLKEQRERAALTQEQLASKARVSRATIAKAEAGQMVRLPTVQALARALKCKPAELMEG